MGDLLRDLWGGTSGAGNSGGGDITAPAKDKGRTDDGKRTFAQVVSSDSSGDDKCSLTRNVKGESKKRMAKENLGGPRLAGVKHQRSPNEVSCGRYFRPSHRTTECRHQIVCLRCACVGHMAARCPVIRSPNRKRLHVRSKKSSPKIVGEDHCVDSRPLLAPTQSSEVQEVGRANRASLSISLTPEIEKLRDELAKVAVLSLVEGQVNDASVWRWLRRSLTRSLPAQSPHSTIVLFSFLRPVGKRLEKFASWVASKWTQRMALAP